MDLNKILLVGAALLPAVVLCFYIFKKDRAEKEPIGLLFGLLGLGVAICFPAAKIEGVLIEVFDTMFQPFTYENAGESYLPNGIYVIYNACKYFIGVALVEEGLKFLAMFLLTRKNKNFNSLFDGIVYAVFVSLGFAAFENVLYVLENGWMNALLRGVLSVPGHMFFAVLMGYYYSFWHIYKKANVQERGLKQAGLIPADAKEFSGKKFIVFSLLVPTVAHGIYDFCCTLGTTEAVLVFYGFIIFLYIYCFIKIHRMSKLDVDDNTYSSRLVLKKYPYLASMLCVNVSDAEVLN